MEKGDPIGVHLTHCYQGEYEDVCKYGDKDCPAWIPRKLTEIEEMRGLLGEFLEVADIILEETNGKIDENGLVDRTRKILGKV